jgi:hypothetical protein
MRASREEIQHLADELYGIGKRLYEIAARLADNFTEYPATCQHNVPLIRKSVIDDIPIDKAMQIIAHCPKCGAGTSIAGMIPADDDEIRRMLSHR